MVTQYHHKEHGLLLSFCRHWSYVAFVYVSAKVLLNLQCYIHIPHLRKAFSYTIVFYLSRKRSSSQGLLPTLHWLEPYCIATSNYKGNWRLFLVEYIPCLGWNHGPMSREDGAGGGSRYQVQPISMYFTMHIMFSSCMGLFFTVP